MPAKGYKAVRNLAGTGKKDFKTFFSELDKNYEMCEHCSGTGTVDLYDDTVYEGVSSVKVSGNKLLEQLEYHCNLSAENMNRIIKKLVHEQTDCEHCNGLGLVKKSRKKNNEGLS